MFGIVGSFPNESNRGRGFASTRLRFNRACSSFVAFLWHGIQSVRKLSSPHSPPPSITGVMWSASHQSAETRPQGMPCAFRKSAVSPSLKLVRVALFQPSADVFVLFFQSHRVYSAKSTDAFVSLLEQVPHVGRGGFSAPLLRAFRRAVVRAAFGKRTTAVEAQFLAIRSEGTGLRVDAESTALGAHVYARRIFPGS